MPASLELALARREEIAQWPEEREASIAPGEDHKQPAELAHQYVDVAVPGIGEGKLLTSSTHSLEWPDNKIDTVYLVMHGVLRNAIQYRDWYAQALGEHFNSRRTAIVAPQFAAPIDSVGSDVLRWNYHDWRGGEPALEPSSPISSFDALDVLTAHIFHIWPNVRKLHGRGNSEGAQLGNLWFAYSKALSNIEERDVTVEAITCNAGTKHYFHPIRTYFDAEEAQQYAAIAKNSEQNRWPYGTNRMPPYITHDREGSPLVEADVVEFGLRNYLRRVKPYVGEVDSNKNGSQVPIGPGPDAQGGSRLDRALLHHILYAHMGEPTIPFQGLTIVRSAGHSALAMFEAIEKDTRTWWPTQS